MKISDNAVVSLKYKLFDAQGELIEESKDPMVYLHGGIGGLFPKVRSALEGKGVGAGVRVKLEPEDAFGDYDAELVRVEDRSKFPETLEVGMMFEGMPGDAPKEDAAIYTVTDIADGKVVLDGNHALAGLALVFEAKVVSVRAADDSEFEHGHAHGAGGHQHH